MNDISEFEYNKEITTLANDIISEIRDDMDDQDDMDELGDLAQERVGETVDDHQWIIYYFYNLQVLEHSQNPDAWEDCYSGEDLGRIIEEQGLNSMHAVLAYHAMERDLSEKVGEALQEIEDSLDA